MQSVATTKTLLEKRAELVLDLEGLQAAIRRIVKQLEGVDSTLKLFGHEPDSTKIMRQNHRGENARIVLGIMREAKRGITSEEVADKVIIQRKLDTQDRELRLAMIKRVRGCLAHYRRKGLLKAKENKDSRLEWSVAGS
jgi:hypothetical protein